jgi:hypothetical protein
MFDSTEELLQKIRLGEDIARNILKEMKLHDPVLVLSQSTGTCSCRTHRSHQRSVF